MKKNSPSADASDRKPRLLFVGEGPHDVGREDEPGGALAGLLHAVLCGPGEPFGPDELSFVIADICYWTRIQIQLPIPRQRRRTFAEVLRLSADTRRAQLAMVQAVSKELDGVVILRDCEQSSNIHLGDTLRAAREAYAAAETNPDKRPALIVAAPSRCHETWLLADREATQAVLGDEGIRHFSGNPEDRPHCDELKRHLKLHAERLQSSLTEVRRRLSFRACPTSLAERCEHCYPPFRQDVEQELRARFHLAALPVPSRATGRSRRSRNRGRDRDG